MSTILDLAILVSVTDHATRGINGIISQFRLMENASDEALRSMEKFKQMTFVGAGMGLLGAGGISAVSSALDEVLHQAGDLEEVMTSIKTHHFGKDLFDSTKAEEVKNEMKEIKDLANELGMDTTFSNIEAGQAIFQLQKGSVSMDDIKGGAAEAAVKFAQLNEMDIYHAAEAMVQTRAGFQLTGNQMLEAADIMTKVAAASSADAEDINRGLGNMGGVASYMWGNRSKEEQVLDSSVLVALTRTQTPEGSSAGTYVRNFLQRLVPKTNGQISAMDDLGWLDEKGRSIFLDYSQNPNGELKSVMEITDIIRKTAGVSNLTDDEMNKQFELAEQGLSTDETVKYFHKIFGEQGGRTAYTLLRTGEGAIEEIYSGVDHQLSLSEQVAIQMDNLNQVIDTAVEHWNVLKSVIGEPLLDGAKEAFKELNRLMELAADYFEEHPEVSQYMFAIAGGVSAFLLLGGVILTTVGAFGMLKIALTTAGITMGGVLGVSIAVFLGFAAIAGIAYLIYKNWDPLKEMWDEHGWAVKGLAGIFLIAYTPAILAATGKLLGLAAVSAYTAIQTAVLRTWTLASAFVMGAYRSVVLAITTAKWLYALSTGAATASTWLHYAAIIILTPLMITIRLAVLAWTGAQWLLNVALTANPIGAVIMIIVALIGVVALIIYKWKDWWGALKDFAADIPGWALIVMDVFLPIVGIPLTIAKYWDDAIKKVKEFLGIEVEEPSSVTFKSLTNDDTNNVQKGGVVEFHAMLETQQADGDLEKWKKLKEENSSLEVAVNPEPTAEEIHNKYQNEFEEMAKSLEAGMPVGLDTSDISSEQAKIEEILKESGVEIPVGFDFGNPEELIEMFNSEGLDVPINANFEDVQKEFEGLDAQLAVPRNIEVITKLDWEHVKEQTPLLEQHMLDIGKKSGLSFADGLTSVTYAIISAAMLTKNGLLNNLPKEVTMHSYGANLIESFAKGILSKIENVRSASRQVADAIHDNLGVQSPTKEGPLRTNHLWGGNLMVSLASGMLDKLQHVRKVSEQVAYAMTPNLQNEQSSIRPINPNQVTNSKLVIEKIEINQQAGEDGEKLAKRVADEVERRIERKKANGSLTKPFTTMPGIAHKW